SCVENGWFTEENVRSALAAVAERMLDAEALSAWAARYPAPAQAATVGLVMAGNIPLVGFHDWLCVFVTGHRALIKLSEKDKRLLPALIKTMGSWEKASWAFSEFLPENTPMQGFDAVIATGSNNTARYFEQYFGKYPHIIRKNRNSVAVLDGTETPAELLALGRDVFAYFGLGCRNVSKIYVPANYHFDRLLDLWGEYNDLITHHKYKNNFDYNLTLFLLNNVPCLHNGCIILSEEAALASRIACLHYEHYSDLEALSGQLRADEEQLQCIVSRHRFPGMDTTPFGATQAPGLLDYADRVDIMAFLAQVSPA
ncbi:MAG: acyl-CoA reductase, partial [Saprospiraceae bacterium]